MKMDELLAMRPARVDWERCQREAPGLAALAADITHNGVREPIVVQDGEIVDGIHRLFVLWLLGYRGEVQVVGD